MMTAHFLFFRKPDLDAFCAEKKEMVTEYNIQFRPISIN